MNCVYALNCTGDYRYCITNVLVNSIFQEPPPGGGSGSGDLRSADCGVDPGAPRNATEPRIGTHIHPYYAHTTLKEFLDFEQISCSFHAVLGGFMQFQAVSCSLSK